MSFPLRFLLYVVGGALLMTLVDLPGGWVRLLAVLALIVAAAYLDHWITSAPRPGRAAPDNLVSLKAWRQRPAAGPAPRERRAPQPVYATPLQAEAESLLQVLRAEGLRPVMVMQNRQGGGDVIYEIRVGTAELKRARPLVDLFVAQSVRAPS